MLTFTAFKRNLADRVQNIFQSDNKQRGSCWSSSVQKNEEWKVGDGPSVWNFVGTEQSLVIFQQVARNHSEELYPLLAGRLHLLGSNLISPTCKRFEPTSDLKSPNKFCPAKLEDKKKYSMWIKETQIYRNQGQFKQVKLGVSPCGGHFSRLLPVNNLPRVCCLLAAHSLKLHSLCYANNVFHTRFQNRSPT